MEDDELPSQSHRQSSRVKKSSRRNQRASSEEDGNEDDYEEEPDEECHSSHDEITGDELPRGQPHVCWVSPDKSSKMCFSLRTLAKIAVNVGKGRWLQPPHFRAPMHESLLKQMFRKFGEDRVTTILQFSQDGSFANGVFGRWAESRLSRLGDLHVCPVCYEAVRWYVEHEQDGSDDFRLSEATYVDGDVSDPMHILMHFPGPPEGYESAAYSVFTSKKELVAHLASQEFHPKLFGPRRKKSPVLDSEFYKKYKIREADGLLQRYLNLKRRARPPQAYWRENSLLFIELHYRVSYREHLADFHAMNNMNPALRVPREVGQALFEAVAEPFMSQRSAADDDFIASSPEDDDSVSARASYRRTFEEDDDEDDEDEASMQRIVRALEQRARSEAYDDDEASASAESEAQAESESEVEAELSDAGAARTWSRAKRRRLHKERTSRLQSDTDASSDSESDSGAASSWGRLHSKVAPSRQNPGTRPLVEDSDSD